MTMRRAWMACAIGLAFAGTVSAQAVVVPNIYTSTVAPGGSGLNTLIRDSGNPRTAQLLINANELTTIPVGAEITGFTARMYVGNLTGFPASTATWADYTINMGPGVAFGSQTTTFASNFASAPTTVRSGQLTINASSFPGGAAPNPNAFGPVIAFGTPYTYTGGNLLMEVRHTGSNIVNGATDFLEAVTHNRSAVQCGFLECDGHGQHGDCRGA